MPPPEDFDKSEMILTRAKTWTDFFQSVASKKLLAVMICFFIDLPLVSMRLVITESIPGEVFWLAALFHGIAAIYIIVQGWCDVTHPPTEVVPIPPADPATEVTP